MEDLKKLIKDTYQNLPEDLQQAVMNPSLKERLEDIGRKNNLNEAQVQALKNETYFVLLALETISDFQTNLDKQINLGEEKSGKIALSVYDGVFKPVEITLLAIEQIIKEKESEEGIVEVEEEKPQMQVQERRIDNPAWNSSQTKPQEREQSSSISFKEMVAPKVLKPQKIAEEVNLSRNKDAAIEETLRRAKAAIEGNLEGEENKEGESAENSNDLGDLESEDFKWPGDISGVEIENKGEGDEAQKENGIVNDEDLNKATILEEIEHPPAYISSPFEEKMKQNRPSPITKVAPAVNNKIENGKVDPYRESIL